MKLTTRSEYGLLAMLDLAKHGSLRLVQSHDVAQRQSIPEPYLNQLLTVLSRAGLITSRRGPGGGYVLARPAETISIGEVISLLEGSTSPTSDEDKPSGRTCSALLRKICQEAQEAADRVLNSVSLADLLQQESARALRYDI
jgi:Rrf2 family protein